MKKINIFITFALSATFTLSTFIIAHAGIWHKDNNGWKYQNENNQDVTGWILDNEKYYYIGDDGYMLSDTISPDGYKLLSDGSWDGALITGNWGVSTSVVEEIRKQGDSIANELRASGRPVENSVLHVYENKATFDIETGAPNIELIKNGGECQLNIYVRLQSYNKKGLKELLKLTGSNSDQLYEAIFQSYETSGSKINYETFEIIGNHQVKAVKNSNYMTYIIR
ncbi:hypothetical protein [Lacrimispora brassicae]